jgi:hypothetical protein
MSLPSGPATGPLPLMIGVSGHRDLRELDYPRLESSLNEIFNDLQVRYPSTPLILLSPLAEGADRLVARVALQHHARLIVALPMRKALYEKDFESTSSRQEFEDLLKVAEKVIEVPLVGNNTEPSIQEYGEPRNMQYAAVGAFIARYSQILIALWDGADTKLTGGTSQIVEFNLSGVPEPYAPVRNLLDRVECGPVFQIVTPRIKNPNPHQAFDIVKRFPSADQAHDQITYDRIWKREDTLNRDALGFSSRFAEALEKSKNYLFPNGDAEKLSPSLRKLRDAFAVSDALAIHNQRMAHRVSQIFFLLIFAAVFFYQIYPNIFPDGPWDAELYFVSLVVIFALYLFSRRKDFENKFLDYRALAEGLRVQFFWRIAGLPDSAADYYLHKQKSELDWIRDAVRAFSLQSREDADISAKSNEDQSRKRLDLVLSYWVKDQTRYFSKSSWRDQGRVVRFKYWSQGLLLLGTALAFIKIIANPVLRFFAVAMALAPAIGALLSAYAEQRGFSQHVKQYGRMSDLFTIAKERLDVLIRLGNFSSARELIRELGKEALAENGDWVILHRERPIEIIKATS